MPNSLNRNGVFILTWISNLIDKMLDFIDFPDHLFQRGIIIKIIKISRNEITREIFLSNPEDIIVYLETLGYSLKRL